MIARVRGMTSGPPPQDVVSLGMSADTSALVAAWTFGVLSALCLWQDIAVRIVGPIPGH